MPENDNHVEVDPPIGLADFMGSPGDTKSLKIWDSNKDLEKIIRRTCDMGEMAAKGYLTISFRRMLGIALPMVETQTEDTKTGEIKTDRFDPVTYYADKAINVPKGFIEEVKSVLTTISPDGTDYGKFPIRIVELPESRKRLVRNLRVTDLGKLIAIDGMVRRVTPVEPGIKVAVFKCENCHTFLMKEQNDLFKLEKPSSCGNTDCKGKTFKLQPLRCQCVDSQLVTLQESQDGLHGGQTPQSITVELVMEDLVGMVNPGDRITINGMVKSRLKMIKGEESTQMTLYLEGISVEISEKEFEEVNISDKDEEDIIILSNNADLVPMMVASVAPAIIGYEDIKLAVLLQIFGGLPKLLPDGTVLRGDSHVLLVSDPGMAKSQLLDWALKLSPRSVKASGQATTGAGLTAAAVRDEVTGQWGLDGGALVMADKGFCAIDEMDKMDPAVRSTMHEAMEQQTISVAKAGITATLRTRCSILGAANPKDGRFDPNAPFGPQVDMPSTLLSRFDLTFTFCDRPDRAKDTTLSDRIQAIHRTAAVMMRKLAGKSNSVEVNENTITPPLMPDFIRKYVAYARRNCMPVLTKEASDKFTKFYVDLRAKGQAGRSPEAVSATARQLEGMVRLGEAAAKMRLSESVSAEDADLVIKLVTTSLYQVAFDPKTGEIDIDRWIGMGKETRDLRQSIRNAVRDQMKLNDGKAVYDLVIATVNAETKADDEEIIKALDLLIKRDEILELRHKKLLQLN